MNPFTCHTGKVAGLNRSNIDTDQIIPKQFLKRIERSGFGQFLFFDWRYNQDGTPNPEFELNYPENKEATILVANENFGCGSSREHAPWALMDYGFKAVIAPSFADIFHQNCLKNGVLPITLPADDVQYLLEQSKQAEYECTIDLGEQTVKDNQGFRRSFEINGHWRNMLLNGWDEIDYTLSFGSAITAFENK